MSWNVTLKKFWGSGPFFPLSIWDLATKESYILQFILRYSKLRADKFYAFKQKNSRFKSAYFWNEVVEAVMDYI